MKYLCVIPARGGSKGCPGKNIKKLWNKPLINHSIDTMLSINEYDIDLVVSTDSKEIKEVVKSAYPDLCIIDRPAEYSTDTAKSEDALKHAIDYLQDKHNKSYDAVILIQATCPFRRSKTVKKGLSIFEEKININDSIVSLSQDNHYFWKHTEEGFKPLDWDASQRRQDRDPYYFVNGVFYVTKTESLMSTGTVFGKNPDGFIISDIEAFDIDTVDDFVVAEACRSIKSNIIDEI